MANPTKKQLALLKFIEQFTQEHDVSPTYREIQAALGLRSVSAVAEHINNCVTAGYLKKTDNTARSLEVLIFEKHPEAEALFAKKITALEARLAEHPEDEAIKDGIATLKAAAKLLGVTPRL